MSGFYAVFGETLVAARLMGVAVGAGTVVALYLIGHELRAPLGGAVAGLLYAISAPSLFWGSLLKLEPAGNFVVSLGVWLFLRGHRTRAAAPFVLSGLVLGAAVFVRRSAIALCVWLAAVLVVRWASRRSGGEARPVLAFGAGGTLSFVVVVGALLAVVDGRWLWEAFGNGAGVADHHQTPLARAHAIATGLMLVAGLLVGALVAALPAQRGRWPVSPSWGLSLLAGVGALAVWAAVARSGNFGFGIIRIPGVAHWAFFSLLLAGIVVALARPPSSPAPWRVLWLPLGWTFSLVVLYGFYPHTFTDYVGDFTPPLALAAGLALARLASFPGQTRRSALATVAAVVILLFPSVFALSPLNPLNAPDAPPYNRFDRPWSPGEVEAVADVIARSTSHGDRILTADTVFASVARRPLVHNLSYPEFYRESSDPFPYDPYNLFPSVESLVSEMEADPPAMVVYGFRTEEWFRQQPLLGRLLATEYAPAAFFPFDGWPTSVTLYVSRDSLDREALDLAEFEPEESEHWRASGAALEQVGGAPTFRRGSLPAVLARDTAVLGTFHVGGEIGFTLAAADEYYYVRFIRSPDFRGVQILALDDDSSVPPRLVAQHEMGNLAFETEMMVAHLDGALLVLVGGAVVLTTPVQAGALDVGIGGNHGGLVEDASLWRLASIADPSLR